jgi:SAM-dependent methyltransferase
LTGEDGAKLILDHHDGRHVYSDGPVEEDILGYVSSNRDLQEIVREDRRWPVLYHLSDMRRNLLEWYDFNSEGSLLEVGAGCGALTGLFCEKLRQVTAVEISPRRAKIAQRRHEGSSNLKVYAGRLQDLPQQEKFDYVTLIGVLEYAGTYGGGPDPYLTLLQDCLLRLNDGGTLIIGVENRLGLKYWAGAPEDHTGRMFDGLEGYPSGPGVKTMGRKELLALLKRAGLPQVQMYYPWPDYKLPTTIYSDARQPGLGECPGNAPNYDQPRYGLFREGLVQDMLYENGLSAELANSFLAFCHR